jgi:peroxiredoxin
MSLEDDLAAQRRRAWEARDPKERKARAGAVDDVDEAGIPAAALTVGDSIPRFTLPDARGRQVTIAELLASGPVVISFYRGGWCPYCNLELRALQVRLLELRELGATLVAISPEPPDRSLSTVQRNELSFPVLSDLGNRVARQFRLVHRIAPEVVAYQLRNGNDVASFNGAEIAEVPLPATYVVDSDGRVEYAFVSADYTRRSEPDDVLAVVRKLNADRTAVATRAAKGHCDS